MTVWFKADNPRTARSAISAEGLRLREYSSRPTLIKEIEGNEDLFCAFLISYQSDGLKVFARVNVPSGQIPDEGFPVVVFAHGYSPNPADPEYYRRLYYESWKNAYAEAGFIVIVPGYRGHGVVDGENAEGKEYIDQYGNLYLTSPFYAVDILNLMAGISTIEAFHWGGLGFDYASQQLLNVGNLFFAAHSMGGEVALLVLAVKNIFNAASIWTGVTAPMEDVVDFYAKYDILKNGSKLSQEAAIAIKWKEINLAIRSTPFLLDDINVLNGYYYLEQLTAPVVIHQGTEDDSVSSAWAVNLDERIRKMGKQSRLYLYDGNDHELSRGNGHSVAIGRDVAFFRKHIRKNNGEKKYVN